MKKLVTLSAIAMAGATLGVGTTFGWWQEKSVQPRLRGDFPAGREEVGDLAPFVIHGDKATDGALVFDAKNRPAESFAKLADDLEREAQQFEERGQKELAEVQRKVARRLRDFLKAHPQSAPKLLIIREGATEKPGKGAVERSIELKAVAGNEGRNGKKAGGDAPTAQAATDSSDEKVEEKKDAEKFTEIAKRPASSPEPNSDERIRSAASFIEHTNRHIEKLIASQNNQEGPELERTKAEVAELQAKLKHILHAQQRVIEAHKDAVAKEQKAVRAATARQQEFELAHRRQSAAEGVPGVVRQLMQTAEQLEKSGQKEAAEAVRKHAATLLPKPGEVKVELQRNGEGNTERDKQGGRSEERGASEERMAIIRLKGHPVEGMRIADRGSRAAEASPDGPSNLKSSQVQELHQVLRELRREVSALRNDVRELRGLLRPDRSDRDEVRTHEEGGDIKPGRPHVETGKPQAGTRDHDAPQPDSEKSDEAQPDSVKSDEEARLETSHPQGEFGLFNKINGFRMRAKGEREKTREHQADAERTRDALNSDQSDPAEEEKSDGQAEDPLQSGIEFHSLDLGGKIKVEFGLTR